RQAPTVCKLTGRLEGDFLRVQAEFKFQTDRPRAVVALGCQGAQPSEAKLDPTDANPDGKLPLLEAGDDGFAVTVEQPGEHVLTLLMKLPVVARSPGVPGSAADRGFELGLPGAAITTLDLELPPAVKEVRWNEQVEGRPAGARPGRWEIALGKIKSLNL